MKKEALNFAAIIFTVQASAQLLLRAAGVSALEASAVVCLGTVLAPFYSETALRAYQEVWTLLR